MSVRAGLDRLELGPGDVAILNDPYLGGTHLPDVSLMAPVFDSGGLLVGYVANRGHHADIGGMAPGSLPLSTELLQEGIVIPPLKLVEGGWLNEPLLELICRNTRTPEERRGDFAAQLAAIRIGERRMLALAERYGLDALHAHMAALLDYAESLTRAAIARLPAGRYSFTDWMEGDGVTSEPFADRLYRGPRRRAPDRGLHGHRAPDRRLHQRAARRHRVGGALRAALPGGRRAGERRRPPRPHGRRAVRESRERNGAARCQQRQRRDLAAHHRCPAGVSCAGIARARPRGEPGHDEQRAGRRPRPQDGRGVRLLRDRRGRPRRERERTGRVGRTVAHDQHAEYADRGVGVRVPRCASGGTVCVRAAAAPACTTAATASCARSSSSRSRG